MSLITLFILHPVQLRSNPGYLIGILSFCLFACVQCSVTVLGHNITTTFVLIEHGGSPSATENITYELIFDDGGDLTGKFVLLVSPVPIENSLRNIQSRGAVGALVQSRQGMNSLLYDYVINLDCLFRR